MRRNIDPTRRVKGKVTRGMRERSDGRNMSRGRGSDRLAESSNIGCSIFTGRNASSNMKQGKRGDIKSGYISDGLVSNPTILKGLLADIENVDVGNIIAISNPVYNPDLSDSLILGDYYEVSYIVISQKIQDGYGYVTTTRDFIANLETVVAIISDNSNRR